MSALLPPVESGGPSPAAAYSIRFPVPDFAFVHPVRVSREEIQRARPLEMSHNAEGFGELALIAGFLRYVEKHAMTDVAALLEEARH